MTSKKGTGLTYYACNADFLDILKNQLLNSFFFNIQCAQPFPHTMNDFAKITKLDRLA